MILKVVVVNYFIHLCKTVRIPPAVISKPFPLLLHFMQLNSANFELTNVLRVVGTCCRLKIKYSPICKPKKPRSQTTSTTLAGPRPNHLHNAPPGASRMQSAELRDCRFVTVLWVSPTKWSCIWSVQVKRYPRLTCLLATLNSIQLKAGTRRTQKQDG